MDVSEQTYTDDGGVRYYRHRPEPVRSFEICVDIPGRCEGLVLGTPDGVHESRVEIRAHRNGRMERVLRLECGPDGLTVTDTIKGEQWTIRLADL